MFFEALAECFLFVSKAAVVVMGNVVDGSTLVLVLKVLSVACTTIEQMVLVGLW